MQKEIISIETSVDFILGHTLRHRGSCVLKRGFNYATGTSPLVTNTAGINPVVKLPQGIRLHHTCVEEAPNLPAVIDYFNYLPCRSNKLFKYPAQPTVMLSTLQRVDDDRLSLTGTGLNDSLFNNRYIHYQTDYEAYIGYDDSGSDLRISLKLPWTTPTLTTGAILAIEADISVKFTDPEHYCYFKVASRTSTSDGVLITVTPVTKDGATVAFAWADLLGREPAPSNGISIATTAYPYVYLQPLMERPVIIKTVPAGKEHLLGAWTFTSDGINRYLYKLNGTIAADSTPFNGVTASLAVDAVEYDISAVVVNTGQVAAPLRLAFIDENRVNSRSMMPSTYRRFSHDSTNDVAWTPAAGAYARQYVLVGKSYTELNTWSPKDNDMYMACPPTHMPFVMMGSAHCSYYNINLGFGRREDVSPNPYFQKYTKALRRSSIASQAVGAGIITMSKGQACPPGWKEILGEIGDTSEAVDILEPTSDSATLNVPSTMKSAQNLATAGNKVYLDSVSYDENTNTTTIVMTPKNGVSSDFFKDTFYDWSIQYKNQPVKMLPRPDPSTAELTVNVGWFKFRVPVPFAPKLPPRAQRQLKIPYGDRVMTWAPGVQALFIENFAKDAGSTELIESDGIVIGTVTGMKVRTNYASKETPVGSTYPTKYPTSIFRQLALGIGSLGGGYSIYRWVDKLLGREALPAITTYPVGELTVELSIYGNFEDRLKTMVNHLNESFIIFAKTGYLRSNQSRSGITGFGSQQHNHVLSELNDGSLMTLNFQIKQTTWGNDEMAHFPPVAKNHGHGWLGEGSYNRPQATAVKLCVKL